jgi:RNA polymerase sigma factor (sigma-70 family)
MSGSNNEGRGLPRQRDAAPEVAHLVQALSPEVQGQWDLMYRMAPSVRRIIYQRTNLPVWAREDIESRVWVAIYARLKNGGPLNPALGKIESYLWTTARREARDYLEEVKQRAERFVGDDEAYLLDGETRSVEDESLADLAPAMTVLREDFTDFQRKVFVLAEAYSLKAPQIAELLGGTATNDSVRDALRHARRKLKTEHTGVRLGLRAVAED